MRAVSNTSPISALASIGRLDLLQSQFSEVWIPPSVAGELNQHPDSDALASIRQAISENRIKLAAVTQSHLLNVLSLQLHSGEAEAIALASDLKVDVVLIDEQEARRLAMGLGLAVTGVLGILLRAKLTGVIATLKPEIQSLRTKARFLLHPRSKLSCLLQRGNKNLNPLRCSLPDIGIFPRASALRPA